jgi:mitochondrial fission protein ELM1
LNAGAAKVATLVLGSDKAGHEANVLGVAEALGAPYRVERPASSRLFAALAPYGPTDPATWRRLCPSTTGVSIAIASGRVTVPYLRRLKRERGDELFAVFLQDPRTSRDVFDLIWAPEHDALRGRNVMTTLTSPHPVTATKLARLRAAPNPLLARLPGPRAAVILGGPSRGSEYSADDLKRLGQAVAGLSEQGFSVLATPSRRTPPEMLAVVRDAVAGRPSFVWDGTGENPYAAMLAIADMILVTADSANMVGEATATGAPVYVFSSQSAADTKLRTMIDGLKAQGAVRDFAGTFEPFSYAPIDSSGAIAREIRRRMAARGL